MQCPCIEIDCACLLERCTAYRVGISVGLGHINNYVIVGDITVDDGDNDVPIICDWSVLADRDRNHMRLKCWRASAFRQQRVA